MHARTFARTIALAVLVSGAAACAKDDAGNGTDTVAGSPAAGASAAAAISPAFPGLATDSAGIQGAPGAPQGAAAAPASSPASAAKLQDDLASIATYRLTMEKVNRYIAAQRGIGRKLAAMTPAQREAMRAEAARDDASDDTLDDTVRRLEANAVVISSIREAGLSAREYATVMVSLMQASMAISVMQMRPGDNQDSLARAMNVNPANLAFMKANQAELARKSEELAADMQRLGIER